jgi:hypothetical protein
VEIDCFVLKAEPLVTRAFQASPRQRESRSRARIYSCRGSSSWDRNGFIASRFWRSTVMAVAKESWRRCQEK